MKLSKKVRKFLTALGIGGLLFGSALLGSPVDAGDIEKTISAVIKIAPPAPVFDEKDRLSELAQRRISVAQKIGPKAVLILFSAEPRVYTNDVDYEYRQENNLYYLTNLKQKSATLVLMPGNTRTPEILFMPQRNSFAEIWNGRMYSAEDAAHASGIKEIYEAHEFDSFLQALRTRQPYRPKPENVIMSAASSASPPGTPTGYEALFAAVEKNEGELHVLVPREADSREYAREQRFASDWAKSATGYNVKNASPIFAEMRLRKSPSWVIKRFRP